MHFEFNDRTKELCARVQDFMDRVGLLPYERILCGNMANGERFERSERYLKTSSRVENCWS